MAYQEVLCPYCQHSVKKRGFSSKGVQRYYCKHCRRTFQTQYNCNACKPGMKNLILDQAMNGGGIRDIGRTLKVSTGTILSTLKGVKDKLVQVNEAALETLRSGDCGREVEIVCASERDEPCSSVQNKADQRWLWHAVDRATNTVFASVFGERTDEVFMQLYELLKPFQVTQSYTDGWGVYHRILPADNQTVSKRETQRIERKHLDFRTRLTRLARKTICFSTSVIMHDTVIGLFINRYEFGRTVTA